MLVIDGQPGDVLELSGLTAVADGTGVDVDWDLDGFIDESAVVSAGQVMLHQGTEGTQSYVVYLDHTLQRTLLIDSDIIVTHTI